MESSENKPEDGSEMTVKGIFTVHVAFLGCCLGSPRLGRDVEKSCFCLSRGGRRRRGQLRRGRAPEDAGRV